jgi:DNA primase small subunit
MNNETVYDLNSLARKEIVDYVTGTGINVDLYLRRVDRKFFAGPRLDDPGWNGRIARGIYEFLLEAGKKDVQDIGIKGKTLDQLINKKDEILRSWKESGPWGLIKGIDEEKWKKIMEQGIKNQSSKIDTVVTTDIHRLIRLPNTLHGKTGLLKTSFPTDDIERFDPLKNALALKSGEITILVDRSPQFRLGEESFGPYKDQKVELPMAAAVFLLCKDAARIVE